MRTYTYHGETITRDHRGYYLTRVLVGDERTGYFRPLQADTLVGIRELIRETHSLER
jgi:hypothetical protein